MNSLGKSHSRKGLFLMLCIVLFACKTSRTAKEILPPKQNKPAATTIPFYPLQNENDLTILINQVGEARIVLLGEATHGTAEFYNWRTAITKRLIQEKGFDFIAVEGDWQDAYCINNFIKQGKKDSAETINLLKQLNRWPKWLWTNNEAASLITWLNAYSQQKPLVEKVGFFGLDLYAFWKPITEQIPYLTDTALIHAAQKVKRCFEPYGNDAMAYTKVVNQQAGASCKPATDAFANAVQKITGGKPAKNETEFLLQQAALIAVNGERYFRNILRNRTDTWNSRDNHMSETIKRLLNLYGPDSKVIVWAHNTHVGDARYAEMHFSGKTNIGELVRKEFGADKVFIVGFGFYSGSFIAAQKWGEHYQKMEVPAAVPRTFEYMLHKDSAVNKIILSKDIRDNPLLKSWVGNRAMGVENNPNQLGTFAGSLIPQRYDAFIYIDHATAIHPIDTLERKRGE